MKKLVSIVVSDVNRVVAFEALCELSDPKRFAFEFLLLNAGPSELERYLTARAVPVRRIRFRGKRDYPLAFLRLLARFLSSRPDVVNTHLPDASFLGLIAALLAGVPKRVLTRHHSTFHHEFAPRWVPIDRFLSRIATKVVAVSPLVRKVLLEREGVPERKVALVEHGFQLERFAEVEPARVAAILHKYSLREAGPRIGVVSRFIKWKGIQHILPAFRELLKEQPRAVLILANAAGPDAAWLHEQMKGIPAENLREIEFEPDAFALYHCFDVFIHVPVNEHAEAFGQVYVEALAAGLPCIFTLSGIGNELARHNVNCLVVRHQSPDEILAALRDILAGRVPVDTLRRMARESVRKFGIREMIEKLAEVYDG